MTTRRRALPVLLERDFRKMAATEGATVEIECVSAPDPEGRFSGEWLFYVVNASDERFMLVTALARERIVNSPIGMFGLAFGKLALDHLDVPAVAGDVRRGMRSLAGRGHPSRSVPTYPAAIRASVAESGLLRLRPLPNRSPP